ncbi:calpain-2 catalytic subunit [Brachionus plicatilis]|uniref:Calpain-2 catalytic subunit n=1 Tax=Brachionus plicatilis TaxID=10195 RepID=A0A3M7RL98_BRAPC|nr:calpain-2 catalytic subunit [Brachionus plicatilis]
MKKLFGNFLLGKKKSETEFSIKDLNCLESEDSELSDDEISDLEDQELLVIEKAMEDLEEEWDQQELTRSSSKSASTKKKKLINTFKPFQINLFKKQSIGQIRRRNKPFRDPHFPCNLNAIVPPNSREDTSSGNFSDTLDALCQEFHVQNRQNYSELNSKVRWKRPQAICYNLRVGRYEFVIDNNGRSLGNGFTEADYVKCFSSDDCFQGHLGDCFMIATFLSICSNKELMTFVVPMDNAYRKNMKIGAYHFRLWKLGEWYDVVVDDYLPLDSKQCPLFAKNMKYLNEFWICLLEKSVAKFVGRYVNLNGGFTESISMTFSGGVHNLYVSELVKNATNGSPITNNNAMFFARSLQEQFGSVQAASPNVDELFQIFQYALKTKNLIGCNSNLDITAHFGANKGHQYAVTAAFLVNRMKIVRVQNPHNSNSDSIKRTHQYIQFEKFLISKGFPKTYYGEFYMNFSHFLDCYENYCVYNLLPEKPVVKLPKKAKNLKIKCTIFTQWKILHMRGRMSGNAIGSQFRVDFQVKANTKEHLIITLCQEYSNVNFLVVLNLYKNLQQIARYTSNCFSTQQNFDLFLDSGTYIAVFEAGIEIKSSVNVCARIFYNKASQCMIKFLTPGRG